MARSGTIAGPNATISIQMLMRDAVANKKIRLLEKALEIPSMEAGKVKEYAAIRQQELPDAPDQKEFAERPIHTQETLNAFFNMDNGIQMNGLMLAAANGWYQGVDYLLKAGAEIIFGSKPYGQTALHFAAMGGNLQCCKRIYTACPSLLRVQDLSELPSPQNPKPKFNQTALMIAAEHGHEDVVKFFCDHLAHESLEQKDGSATVQKKQTLTVNLVDAQNQSALLLAAANQHFGVIKPLVDAKADVRLICDFHQIDPIHSQSVVASSHSVESRPQEPQPQPRQNIRHKTTVLHLLLYKRVTNEVLATETEQKKQNAAAQKQLKAKLLAAKVAAINALLEAGADADAFDKDDQNKDLDTPLHLAFENWELPVIQALCANANPCIPLSREVTPAKKPKYPITLAVMSNADEQEQVAAIDAIWKAIQDNNATRNENPAEAKQTVAPKQHKVMLQAAPGSPDFEVIQELFLHAVLTCRPAVMNKLVEINPNLKKIRLSPEIIFNILAANIADNTKREDTIRILLAKSWVLNLSVNQDGQTPFMIAVRMGNIPVVNRLKLHKDHDLDIRDNKGRTALIYAAAGGQLECVRIILEEKPDTETPDSTGRTALFHAVERNQLECVNLLLAKNANIEVTAGGKNLFHYVPSNAMAKVLIIAAFAKKKLELLEGSDLYKRVNESLEVEIQAALKSKAEEKDKPKKNPTLKKVPEKLDPNASLFKQCANFLLQDQDNSPQAIKRKVFFGMVVRSFYDCDPQGDIRAFCALQAGVTMFKGGLLDFFKDDPIKTEFIDKLLALPKAKDVFAQFQKFRGELQDDNQALFAKLHLAGVNFGAHKLDLADAKKEIAEKFNAQQSDSAVTTNSSNSVEPKALSLGTPRAVASDSESNTRKIVDIIEGYAYVYPPLSSASIEVLRQTQPVELGRKGSTGLPPQATREGRRLSLDPDSFPAPPPPQMTPRAQPAP